MQEDDILQVENRTVLDYSPEYKKIFIERIKSEYAELCKNDQKLTDEFKNFVADGNNVHVKINYGYDLVLKLYSIDSKWEFDYTLNYVSGTTYTGTAEINSVGDVNITSLDSHDNWVSSKHHREEDVYVFLSGDRYYTSHCKNATLSAETKKHCVSVKNSSNIDPDLAELSKKVFLYDSVTSLMEMPDKAYKESEEKVLNNTYHPRNVKFVKINSFGLSSANVSFFPKSFDVTVNYKGVKYEQKDITLDSLDSKGEETKHYKDFKRLKEKYENKTFGRFITFLSYVAVCTHAILLGIIYLQLFGVPDFLHIFEHENAFMMKVFDRFSILIFIIIAGLTVLGIFLVNLLVHNYECRVNYDAGKSLYTLENIIKIEYRKNTIKNCFKFIVIAAISGALTYVLWFL